MRKIKMALTRIALVGAVTALAVSVTSPSAQALSRCSLAYNSCFNNCGGCIAYFECPPIPEPIVCECC